MNLECFEKEGSMDVLADMDPSDIIDLIVGLRRARDAWRAKHMAEKARPGEQTDPACARCKALQKVGRGYYRQGTIPNDPSTVSCKSCERFLSPVTEKHRSKLREARLFEEAIDELIRSRLEKGQGYCLLQRERKTEGCSCSGYMYRIEEETPTCGNCMAYEPQGDGSWGLCGHRHTKPDDVLGPTQSSHNAPACRNFKGQEP